MAKSFKVDLFLVGLITAIVAAYFFPEIGTMKSPVNLGKLAEWGITFIFFFYGVKLSPKQIIRGMKNWQLHLIVQLATFLVFPIIIIAIKPFVTDENIWISLFFLATLPSTVSSSVVMVSIAEGNIPAAIFNATLSGFLGIVITPLWMGIFMSAAQMDVDTTEIVTKLVFQILVPILLGCTFNWKLGKIANRHSKILKYFDQSVIILIVFTSFSNSFQSGVFQTIGWLEIIAIAIGMIVLFFIVFFFLRCLCKKLKFNYEDTITVLFCGSKKSLMHGAVISKVMFSGLSVAGFVLVPVMLYHSLQLIIVSYIAKTAKKII